MVAAATPQAPTSMPPAHGAQPSTVTSSSNQSAPAPSPQLNAQYFVASNSQTQMKYEPRQSAFQTAARPPENTAMANTITVPEGLPPLPITPNYNRVNETYSGSESSINRFGEETLAKALSDMDDFH